MDIFQSLLYGIVEGITEFLPISSTGHLILLSKFLRNNGEFLKSFEIIIQLGAIMAVIFLYWKKLIQNWILLKKIIVAFIPTAILGLVFYSFVKKYLLSNSLVVVFSLFLGGIAIILFEKLYKEQANALENLDNMTYTQAISIGFIQSIAMIPGVSRSASTIIGGLLAGLSKKAIVEFSFLLAVPTMIAASGLDIIKNYSIFMREDILVLSVGFLTSFFVAILAIKFLLNYIQKNSFISFGIYRIVIAIIFFFLVI